MFIICYKQCDKFLFPCPYMESKILNVTNLGLHIWALKEEFITLFIACYKHLVINNYILSVSYTLKITIANL